jgi:hypothetical protein
MTRSFRWPRLGYLQIDLHPGVDRVQWAMRFCPVLKLGHLIEMRIQDVESLLAEVEQLLSVISYSPSYNSLTAPEAGQDASNYPLGTIEQARADSVQDSNQYSPHSLTVVSELEMITARTRSTRDSQSRRRGIVDPADVIRFQLSSYQSIIRAKPSTRLAAIDLRFLLLLITLRRWGATGSVGLAVSVPTLSRSV